jgi:rhodanese-related sulfurtransferase
VRLTVPASIDRDELRRLLAEGAQLVEVMPPEDFEDLHIAGAVNIPLKDLAERAHELDPGRTVITYCNDFQ